MFNHNPANSKIFSLTVVHVIHNYVLLVVDFEDVCSLAKPQNVKFSHVQDQGHVNL